MPNGTLQLYNKLDNSTLVTLDILSTFNIEDNLNETPSNMKVKVITTNTYREEFQVNTVAYHEDTNTWWVIKSDESSYLTTGEYEHEIQLVEYLEFYAYRHLPNCAFAPNTYDLEDMLNRLFGIAKLSITVTYPNFLDKDKIMPFFSFENFTVANAIKNIARAINAIPKMSVNLSNNGFVPTLTFINRNGADNAIVNVLDTQFPIAYEKNINSNDQFTTRSVSNITNAKSSSLVIAPKSGGFKNITPNSPTYVIADSKVFLPSKIDKVEFVRIFLPIKLIAFYKPTGVTETIYQSYYVNTVDFRDKLIAHPFSFKLPSGYTNAQKEAMADELPTPLPYQQVNYNSVIDKTYNPSTTSFTDNLFFKKMSILNKFDFDTLSVQDTKDRTIHWNPFSNEVVMPLSFRNGLFGGNDEDHNRKYRLYDDSDYEVYLIPSYSTITTSPFAVNVVKNDEILIQVAYYPISDIKVSIDNDNDAQDEKFFNQSGKVIDAVSVSKLITSHTNDSVEGTKIRNAKHFALNDILPLGQLVRDNNQLYVVSQRSIDGMVKNSNEYYNVIYTLSRNRVARSENIIADSSVISYKTPDDNLVFRTQLYKDYIELSLESINQEPEPYLPMTKALVLSSTLAGTNFDFTVLAKNSYGTTPTTIRYVKSPTTFDLHKAKLINLNWQDNNVLGYRLDSTGASYVQTPIVYTDPLGNATNFELLFLDNINLNQAISDYNTPYNAPTYDPLVPFTDLTQVPTTFYTDDVLADGRFSIRIQEDTTAGVPYAKDPFEIPVFEYMIQGNDDYNQLGNIVIGNDLFSTFEGDIRYHYVINNGTRFTAENAIKLQLANAWSSVNDRRVTITRTNANQMDLDLFSVFNTSTLNTSAITNVGFYAVKSGSGEVKFLFAINDYPTESNDNDITVYINNWKI
jgi:hypothetical protein